MCRCKQAVEWKLVISYDDFAAADGWDGDVPLDSGKEWTPYCALLECNCTRCGKKLDDRSDAIGGIWASDDSDGHQHVVDTAFDTLLPRNVSPTDVEIFYL